MQHPAAPGTPGPEDRARLFAAPLLPVATALRTGQTGVADHVGLTLARMERLDSHIRAFLPEPERDARLRREAAELEARASGATRLPRLYGVPVGVKDCFKVAGFPTRAGSGLPPDLFAGREASAVTVLRDAGAVILGKTAMDEFAYVEPAPTRNPHNLAHTPGASSSGSAAAVAVGLCPLALGTQTSRSVIGPAAFCGVVGFKPTYGRIPIDGVIPLAPSFDTVGLFTQDAAGIAWAASVLVPDWRTDEPPRPPVLGVPDGKLFDWTLESGRRAFELQVGQLTRAGYEVRRLRSSAAPRSRRWTSGP